MTAIQSIGHVRFEGGRFVVELPEDCEIKAGAAVIVRVESIDVTV